jgi:two-component system, NtrC family, sensor histidine kinase GlrK
VKLSYPTSFLKLLLIGFALSTLPLLVAFVNANLVFGKLTKQSLLNLSYAVETTRSSGILQDELIIMERSARQFFVLHDDVLLTNYANSHKRFVVAMTSLTNLPISKPQISDLAQFKQIEQDLFLQINHADKESVLNQEIIDKFAQLNSQSVKIINQNNQLIDNESSALKAKIDKTQHSLFWQSLTLIPLAMMIAGLITWMIARPVRRMDAALRQLGSGDYEHAIAINGPGDLKTLGARLDWLRLTLKDLNNQKQLFLQQASHELKTPLTAIREASELLHDGVAGDLNSKQKEILTILRENGVRLQSMIEHLLKYTEMQFRQTSENAPQLPAATTFKSIVDEVVNAYSLTITNKNIDLKKNITEQSIAINADKLRTILDNLVSNAVKFTPENGQISIKNTATKTHLTFEVIDSGPGVSVELANQLYQAFSRGKAPINSLVKGSGLGLFIAKETVKMLKGEINLMPTATGAHFLVSLPL